MNPLTGNDGQALDLGGLLRCRMVLNLNTEEQMECWGYRSSAWKSVLFAALVLLSAGTVLLLLYWKPQLECYLKRSACPLYKASHLLIKDPYNNYEVVAVKSITEGNSSVSTGSYQEGGVSGSESSDDHARLALPELPTVRYFEYRHTRYVWDKKTNCYERLRDLSTGMLCGSLHADFQGLTAAQQADRLELHGENAINVEVKSYWRLFIEEVLNPFYIFQIASVVLWVLEEYYYYAGCIVLISCISIGISLVETRRQSVALHDLASTPHALITVRRGELDYEEVPSNALAPGDVIVIPPHGCVLSCDAVLITGTCIVNESMLTGESVPVTKTPLTQQEDDEMYSPEVHKRHTLFAGTHILQTRYYGTAKVMAVVVRTGFHTAKGELVRAILFPKPLDFKFYQDAMRFVMFLGAVASVGMLVTVVKFVIDKVHAYKIVLRVLDIITIVVPPALPAAMTVGIYYAQRRLKSKSIFCISPPRINFCGRINTFCFDKTGTLTEDGLDMWGVVPVLNQCFQEPVRDISSLPVEQLLLCMTTCHSLTLIDGELRGDPLDLIMFNSTQWGLEEPGEDTSKYDTIMPTVVRPISSHFQQEQLQFEVGIVRQFTFSSNLQRMSVITRTLGRDHMEVFCKGAPEKIASLCLPDTVPEDFQHIMHRYSVQGFRVIALAHRALEPKITWHQVQRVSRDKVERNLNFLGLLVMQNQLKPQTAPVIATLKTANIRTIMVTGDMIQTAISVARNCGMVGPREEVVIAKATGPDKQNGAQIEWEFAEMPTDDLVDGRLQPEDDSASSQEGSYARVPGEGSKCHIAINGRSFAVITKHFPELLPKICAKGTVFARMSPEQKCQLIEQLQQLDLTVGMCGDGANDCEALKAAHAGISLSEAEASVAAPFTSHSNNIECVIKVVREGRAALVTSFGCFKYMALYSFIQFISVLILYFHEANLSDLEFLYIDLIITTTIAICMGYTGPYRTLVARKPMGSLTKCANLMSITLQTLLVIAVQLGAYFFMMSRPWYKVPPPSPNADNVRTWESTVLFLVSSFMYIAVAFAYTKGPPFRKPFYTNYPFLILLIALFGFSTYMILAPIAAVEDFMKMERLDTVPFMDRLYLFLFAIGFIILCNALEYVVMETKLLKPLYCCRRKQKSKYKQVTVEMDTTHWPPVGQVTLPSANHSEDMVITVDTEQAIQ